MMAGHAYYNREGRRVPGVTTILGNIGWGKEQLIRWANNEGLAGRNLDEARKKTADIGTIAHALMEADIKGESVDVSGIEGKMLTTANKILARWKEWRAENVAEFLFAEMELVSEEHQYGGRPDFLYRSKGGEIVLGDLKTGRLYPTQIIQVAAYAIMVEEKTEWTVDRLALLRISRDSEWTMPAMRPYNRDGLEVDLLLHALALHEGHKRLRAEV